MPVKSSWFEYVCRGKCVQGLRVPLHLPAQRVHRLYTQAGRAADEQCSVILTLIKKNKIFLIYKEIQSGAVVMSYMRKPLVIHDFATAPF